MIYRLVRFFPFYGGKRRSAGYYPRPQFDTIIEPFAGSAGYSLYYPHKKVWLYDVDGIICGVWDYLIKASRDEILKLPTIVEDVRNLSICQEAKWLIGFWLNSGTVSPANVPSQWMRGKTVPCGYWGKQTKVRIAYQVDKIRHWKIQQTKYRQIENKKATWFIDPPYQKSGKHYVFNGIDYQYLSQWCQNRLGQKIVCEQKGADWLPFSRFRIIHITPGKNKKTINSHEIVWYG